MGKATKSGKSAPDKLSKVGKKSGIVLGESELGQVFGGGTTILPGTLKTPVILH